MERHACFVVVHDCVVEKHGNDLSHLQRSDCYSVVETCWLELFQDHHNGDC